MMSLTNSPRRIVIASSSKMICLQLKTVSALVTSRSNTLPYITSVRKCSWKKLETFPYIIGVNYINDEKICFRHPEFDVKVYTSTNYDKCLEKNQFNNPANELYVYTPEETRKLLHDTYKAQVIDQCNEELKNYYLDKMLPPKYSKALVNIGPRWATYLHHWPIKKLCFTQKILSAAFFMDDPLEKLVVEPKYNQGLKLMAENLRDIWKGQGDISKMYDMAKLKGQTPIPAQLVDDMINGCILNFDLERESFKILSPRINDMYRQYDNFYLDSMEATAKDYLDNGRKTIVSWEQYHQVRQTSVGMVTVLAVTSTHDFFDQCPPDDECIRQLGFSAALVNDVMSSPKEHVVTGDDPYPTTGITLLMDDQEMTKLQACRKLCLEANQLMYNVHQKSKTMTYERAIINDHWVTVHVQTNDWQNIGHNDKINKRYGWIAVREF